MKMSREKRRSYSKEFKTQIIKWGGVRLALLALSLALAFSQAVVDNANNTSLTPLAH